MAIGEGSILKNTIAQQNFCEEGQSVKHNTPLFTIEAMIMETTIHSFH